ncbi:secretin N-terminal domain-containing protein [Methylocaldum sp.]|uniref:secretin N-terminal domain-containing protein n=1 Tax=Methylocaldum sp. TaxID=1969727 RepID=UPI002D24ADEC|nr:secretin N-terminal domain-containing protein [Methylocaldum sp.]HYE34449.1 secretin N-terminal domain-containing protein [Methylocaldum sp.]
MHLLNLLLFVLVLSWPLDKAWSREAAFDFENAELRTVIQKASELIRLSFIYDPERIKGKITLVSPGKVSEGKALQLLQSALALHGYSLLRQDEVVSIVPAEPAGSIEVVPLDYADAGELAWTLAHIAPDGVRIVPYYPTNSLIIYGDPRAVEALNPVVKGKGGRVAR